MTTEYISQVKKAKNSTQKKLQKLKHSLSIPHIGKNHIF